MLKSAGSHQNHFRESAWQLSEVADRRMRGIVGGAFRRSTL